MLVSNESQNIAIKSDEKFTLIDAGPGAGKTRVLIERIKYLLKKGINPETLLVITFTNKATDELKLRLLEDEDISEKTLSHMQISTIHSFCKKILDEYDETQYKLLTSDDEFNERMIMFLRKNKKKLGFHSEAYMGGSELVKVLDLYNEFTVFEIEDYEKLLEYIKEEYPVSKEYLDFIDHLEKNGNGEVINFPQDEVKENFKEDWYNAKLKKIVLSYPKFLKLLKKDNLIDYNFLQIRACEFLESDKIKDFPFKNILVDEYQDIDPIQDRIFDALIENYPIETFTVVGDADQSIYGFRGSNSTYFSEFANKNNCKPIVLDTNYRSKSEIVNFTEKFIKKYRSKEYSKDLKSYRGDGGKIFYLENMPDTLKKHENNVPIETLKEESQEPFKIRNFRNEVKDIEFSNISKLINHLKDTGKIEKYSDVGILFRNMNSVNGLSIGRKLDVLEENNIPFNLDVPEKLEDVNEIKICVALLSYIRRINPPVFTSFEKEWLNLKFFTSDTFKEFYAFSPESVKILSEIEDEYQGNIIKIENEVSPNFEGSSKRRSFNKIFDEKDEVLSEVFKRAKDLVHDLSNLGEKGLKELGFTNTNDINFILNLNNLKKEFYEDNDYSILSLLYDLLGDYFHKISENQISNIAYFTRIIHNYEEIVDKHDLNGFIWYLNSFLKLYSASVEEDTDTGVNILTIHKAKGLEFPVVILPSFEEDKFPRKYKEKPEVKSKYGFFTNYNILPNKFFKYKNHDGNDEEVYMREEERVIYVAMTRARDLLVLSSIPHEDTEDKKFIKSSSFIGKLKEFDEFEKLNYDNLPSCQHLTHKGLGEIIDLSFSRYNNYLFCPYRFKLDSIHGLMLPTKEVLIHGTIIHEILENLGNISKDSGIETVNSDIISQEIENVFDKFDVKNEDDENIRDIRKNVADYWDNFGSNFKVVGTEIPFNLSHKHYRLNGFIDLVIEKPDGTLKIIDYKNTEKDNVVNHKENYARQLYVYYNSIKEMPKYAHYQITGLSILALKNNAEVEMPVDIEKIQHVNEDLETVAEKIIQGEFPKQPKEEHNCNYCDYNKICKNIKNNTIL